MAGEGRVAAAHTGKLRMEVTQGRNLQPAILTSISYSEACCEKCPTRLNRFDQPEALTSVKKLYFATVTLPYNSIGHKKIKHIVAPCSNIIHLFY